MADLSGLRVAVLGGNGFIGSALVQRFEAAGSRVTPIGSRDYELNIGSSWDLVVNANGNAKRYLAERDPLWDLDASVGSVERALRDLQCDLYVQISTVDVYDDVSSLDRTREDSLIHTSRLSIYGFHKWLAERVVERFARRALILRVASVVGPHMTKGPLFDVLAEGGQLFMSPRSVLAFVDVGFVARVVAQLVERGIENEIVNVAPSAGIELAAAATLLGRSLPPLAPSADDKTYLYRVNHSKLARIMSVPSSTEAVEAMRVVTRG